MEIEQMDCLDRRIELKQQQIALIYGEIEKIKEEIERRTVDGNWSPE